MADSSSLSKGVATSGKFAASSKLAGLSHGEPLPEGLDYWGA